MAKRNTYFQDEKVEKKFDAKQFARIFKYVMPYKKTLFAVLGLMLISALAAMVTPLLLKKIINEVVDTEDYAKLILTVACMVIMAAVEIFSGLAHQTLMGVFGHRVISKVRQDVFYKLQELPFDFFDSVPNGKIVVRVTEYVNDLANFFTNFLLQLLTYVMRIVFVTFFMLSISPALTGVVYLVVLPMMVLVLILRRAVRRLFTQQRAKSANRVAFLTECITGEKIIKNYDRRQSNEEIYMDVQADCVKTWLRIFRRNELNTPIVEFFWNLGTVALYGTALALMLGGNGNMNAGVVVAFTTYMTQFSGPLTQIAVVIQQLAQVSSNLERVFDTIDHPVEIGNTETPVVLKDVKGQVDFEDVTFAYEEGINVLEHFTLHVKPGETIALVGPTGAGKTTVINMLTRFYDVREGSVSIDGVDVRNADLESLRREVGVLMQDPFIFKGTILENIRYGKPEATDEECMEAAKTIHADLFIDKLPEGYNTVLEERGGTLSAGEKQLLSFARIVLKNPSVVILDEATSSIDTETEILIQQAMEVILKEKTAFMVAHRLSTIRNADRILYIADKGIAEEGNHQELMAKKGLYYALN